MRCRSSRLHAADWPNGWTGADLRRSCLTDVPGHRSWTLQDRERRIDIVCIIGLNFHYPTESFHYAETCTHMTEWAGADFSTLSIDLMAYELFDPAVLASKLRRVPDFAWIPDLGDPAGSPCSTAAGSANPGPRPVPPTSLEMDA